MLTLVRVFVLLESCELLCFSQGRVEQMCFKSILSSYLRHNILAQHFDPAEKLNKMSDVLAE